MSSEKIKQPILIIGAGTFGLATAHRLSCAGYTKITVLEKDSEVPSRFSAGFDLNKIVRPDYADPFYTPLTMDAIKKWQDDPLYSPHFRQVGFLNVVTGAAPLYSKNILRKYFASVSDHPDLKTSIVRFPDSSSIKKSVPQLSGAIKGWNGYLNTHAGYVHSANAMKAVYEDCIRRGVSFRLGSWEGEVASLLFDKGSNRCLGAKTAGGNEYFASTIIVALGANAARIIPSIKDQVTARCWGVSHIQLSPDEAAQLRGIPVINVRDIGFYFEPDLATNKLKVCHMGGGFTNHGASSEGVSLPPSKLVESDFILQEDEEACRRLLRESLPHLADRPFIDNHLCWFSDSEDSNFIIDYVPNTKKSLVILAGDSGHGFKMLPIMGTLVQTMLLDGEQRISRWRWRNQDDTKPGSKVVWRTGSSKDLSSVTRAKL